MDEYIKLETLLERAEYDNNYRLIIPVEAIKAVPAADVAPVVHGQWIGIPLCGRAMTVNVLNAEIGVISM